jgi:hypothetical protein
MVYRYFRVKRMVDNIIGIKAVSSVMQTTEVDHCCFSPKFVKMALSNNEIDINTEN